MDKTIWQIQIKQNLSGDYEKSRNEKKRNKENLDIHGTIVEEESFKDREKESTDIEQFVKRYSICSLAEQNE